MNNSSFKEFYEQKLLTLAPKSLTLTKEVLRSRDALEKQLSEL
jgi:hypothetical protein